MQRQLLDAQTDIEKIIENNLISQEEKKSVIAIRDWNGETSERVSFKSGLLFTRGSVLINRRSKNIYKVYSPGLTEEEKNDLKQQMYLTRDVSVPGVIGRGGVGKVKICQNVINGDFCAVKIVNKSFLETICFYATIQDFFRSNEAICLQSQAIFRDIIETADKYYYVMELIKGRPIQEYLENIKKIYSSNKLEAMTLFLSICKKMAEKLDHFHAQGFLHRDVKPDNFMYSPENEVVYLIDFGHSKTASYFNQSLWFFTSKAKYFIAPEVEYAYIPSYSKASDIFGLGKSFEYMIHRLHVPMPSEFYRHFDMMIATMINPIAKDRIVMTEIKTKLNELSELAKKVFSDEYQPTNKYK